MHFFLAPGHVRLRFSFYLIFPNFFKSPESLLFSPSISSCSFLFIAFPKMSDDRSIHPLPSAVAAKERGMFAYNSCGEIISPVFHRSNPFMQSSGSDSHRTSDKRYFFSERREKGRKSLKSLFGAE